MVPEVMQHFDIGARGNPIVSVITIFLNAERFLSEAIESVLAQDFKNFELNSCRRWINGWQLSTSAQIRREIPTGYKLS